MSSRFYFDLTNGLETIRDHQGVEARDLDQAIEEARVVINEMRDSGELSEDEEGWILIIKDAEGDTLMTLPVTPHVSESRMAS